MVVADLWIPNLEETNVHNIYDMMLVYQAKLDKVSDPEYIESWHGLAKNALRRLFMEIEAMSPEERQINVVTEFVLMTSTEDSTTHIPIENIGLRGRLDDVHCIKMGRTIMPTIALGLDVESVYPITNPDEGDLMLTTAVAPISKVHYIQREVA